MLVRDPPTALFALFLDPDLNYSAGLFPTEEISLADAQQLKIHRVLKSCSIARGSLLLDVGCGWGAAARVAAEAYGARVVGISTSEEQSTYAQRMAATEWAHLPLEFRRQRWEDFEDPVDRIVSINSFENFSDKNRFLEHCRGLLPAAGVAVILSVTADRPLFRVMSRDAVVDAAEAAGFSVDVSESLGRDYAITLERFLQGLAANYDAAVELVGAPHVDRLLSFHKNSASFLRSGLNDMFEFVLTAR